MSWAQLADWWNSELASDPAYEEVVTPLLFELWRPAPRSNVLDLGVGEGRVARTLIGRGVQVVGLDINADLAASAPRPVVVARLPEIPLAESVFDGVYSVLTLEHIEDLSRVFTEAARVTKAQGSMTVVMNHPVWTAPDSTPVTDSDGEVLWRPGRYFHQGSTDVPASSQMVTFHHRTVAELVNNAAVAGWSLEEMIERPHHSLSDQSGIPRLLACRWRLLP